MKNFKQKRPEGDKDDDYGPDGAIIAGPADRKLLGRWHIVESQLSFFDGGAICKFERETAKNSCRTEIE